MSSAVTAVNDANFLSERENDKTRMEGKSLGRYLKTLIQLCKSECLGALLSVFPVEVIHIITSLQCKQYKCWLRACDRMVFRRLGKCHILEKRKFDIFLKGMKRFSFLLLVGVNTMQYNSLYCELLFQNCSYVWLPLAFVTYWQKTLICS